MTNSYEKSENSELQTEQHIEITGERTENSHLSDTHIWVDTSFSR